MPPVLIYVDGEEIVSYVEQRAGREWTFGVVTKPLRIERGLGLIPLGHDDEISAWAGNYAALWLELHTDVGAVPRDDPRLSQVGVVIDRKREMAAVLVFRPDLFEACAFCGEPPIEGRPWWGTGSLGRVELARRRELIAHPGCAADHARDEQEAQDLDREIPDEEPPEDLE